MGAIALLGAILVGKGMKNSKG